MTWFKSVVNNKKKLSSLIVEIYNVEQTNRLIKDDLLHEYTQIICELFVNNCRIKQCFNCQRYEHIDKICRYERRCSICSKSHNDFACKMSIDKKNALIVKAIIQFNSFNVRLKLQKRTKSLIYDARNRFYTQQIWKTHRERFLANLTSWFNKRSFAARLHHRRRHSASR
jgi:hypothetical protein